jgi:hypothetical protein
MTKSWFGVDVVEFVVVVVKVGVCGIGYLSDDVGDGKEY